MYKICHVIFSTNRLEYLIPTLRSTHNLNFYNCQVDKIFFDDYPLTRNDNLLYSLIKLYGFNEYYFHKENQGLSSTWNEFWNLIKDRNYDYVFHQEDDIEFLEPVLITDLIELLQHDNQLSQVQLARGAWYYHESDPKKEDDDLIYKNFRYRKGSLIFSPMASLYHHNITKLNYRGQYNFNPNEGMIGKFLYDNHERVSANVKNYYGKKIINHIGEYFVGKRVLPTEPSYDLFAHFDPNQKYHSRDGRPY